MNQLRALLHVGVIVSTLSGSITPAEMTELRTEVARVWQPYGVELTWFDRVEDCASAWSSSAWLAPVDVLVRLSAESVRPAPYRDTHRALGSDNPGALGSVV